MSRDDPRDEDLRLECARLAMFMTEGDPIANAEKLYRFIRLDAIRPGELVEEIDIIAILRRRCDRGQNALAIEAGVSECFLSHVLSGINRPGPKLLNLIGYEPVTMYRRAE